DVCSSDLADARPALAVGEDHRPGSVDGVGAGEHVLPRHAVVVPALDGRVIQRTELPLLQRIGLAGLDAPALLLTVDREPELEQIHAALDQRALQLGRLADELAVLLRGAEAHHALDPGTVVPGAVEEDDLATGRQLADVALEIPLRALGLGRLLQGDHARAAGVEVLAEALDRPALAGRVAPFEEDRQALLLILHPVLQLQQLDLQGLERALVFFPLHARGIWECNIVARYRAGSRLPAHLSLLRFPETLASRGG